MENIFPCICKILLLNDKVTLFFNLHLCDNAWQMVVDKNEDWGIWCVHVAESYLDKFDSEKH
jgi:membrane-anchored protein YejM (alkaline phosphatase superfamily)